MNKSKAIKIAIAFKRGAAFIRGMRQLAQGADGERHGDRVKFAKDVVDWVKSKGKTKRG